MTKYNPRIEAFLATQAVVADAKSFTSVSLELKRFCRKQVAEIIQRASVDFGLFGAPIQIDETRIPVDGHPNIWEAIAAGLVPDLDHFREILRATYEANGPAIAEQQTAVTLCRAFGLASIMAERRSVTVVRLKLVAISESVCSATRPSRQLHFGSFEPVTQAFTALAVFARRMGYTSLATCLAVIQYNEYWELRLAKPITDTLIAFVQQHAGTSPQSA
ncbi:hypothetical protein [Cupriavidus lacunae]|uniref:Uncharacterized protein n=1 Tax=Cupriavidus lacunae TaxID=2666307 RepID=A0A370NKH0_9BURK|nr:hypothetical protein [Cupriavidus lacunae]RDK06085.1 hypothetical protein DN412_33240 [Cupriavidus lacunae]